MQRCTRKVERSKSRRFGWALKAVACLAMLPTAAMAAPAGCNQPGPVLGVSRVVEIDTSTGPVYGQQQYKTAELLAPGEIILTFDDGPARHHTQPILDALDAQCTKATFFMVGSQAVADPEMVKRVLARGHTVGSHTWSHANLQKLTPLRARQEIELGFSAVASAAGQPIAPFFRFPYLAQTKAMLGYSQTRAFGVFSIDVDSRDWKTKSASAVHRDVLRQLSEQGKGIILMHDIQAATAQALPGLLEALRVAGYRVVQLKSKATLTTLPEFDALAHDAKARGQMASASQPLAKRSMTWGAAEPGVLAHMPQTSRVRNGGVGPFTTTVVPTPQPAPVAPPAFGDFGQPQTKVARQRSAPSQDWRDTIFNR